MAAYVTLPFPVVLGRDGLPVENGFVYIGSEGANPETNPISVYWDAALSIPAAQPVRTINGFFSHSGSPGALFVSSAYSIAVREKDGTLVYASLLNGPADAGLREDLADGVTPGNGAGLVTYTASGTGAQPETVAVRLDRWIFPESYGGVANDATDSLAAIQAACVESAATGAAVLIEGPYFVDINDATDPIELASGAHLIFTEKGSIRYDVFGLPCFYANEQAGITIEYPKVVYNGVLATTLPAMTSAFRDATLGVTTATILTRDCLSAFLFVGCDDITVTNPRFTNTVLSNTTVHPRCLVFSAHEDTSQAKNNRVLGDTYIEAASMGILAWGQDRMVIGNIHQVSFGQVDSATYTWEVAGHPLYISAFADNSNILIGDILDEGIALAGAAVIGHTTFELRAIDGLSHGRIFSRQGQGLGDYTAIKQLESGSLHWAGDTAANLAAVGQPLRFLAKNTSAPIAQEFLACHFGTIYLSMPDVDAAGIRGTGSNSDFILRLTIDNLIILINGAALSLSTPLVNLSATHCSINAKLIAPSAPAFTTFCRIDDGGTNNYVNLLVLDGPFDTVRALNEQDKVNSTDNSFRAVDTNGNERVYSNHCAHEVRHASDILRNVSGATVTATSLIPDGAFIIGVSTMITTALGLSGGTTGFEVGTVTDPDRWGIQVATAQHSGTANAQWQSGVNEHVIIGTNVVLTATGGNFDGTGDVRVSVAYMTVVADYNLQSE